MSDAASGRLKRPFKPVPPEAKQLTPPQVARQLQVRAETVIGFIRSGQLRAINIAKLGSRRPRYRISVKDLEDFEARRTVDVSIRSSSRVEWAPNAKRFY
jgi:hypothetical protein